ncbi:MAG: hypothetical protein HY534_03655 [Chloroflexi bacterium]|nr:hypothetical protein [Chloroflexota bacterium]
MPPPTATTEMPGAAERLFAATVEAVPGSGQVGSSRLAGPEGEALSSPSTGAFPSGLSTARFPVPPQLFAIMMALAAAIVGLVYLEIELLPNQMPRDRASRVALAAFPDATASDRAALPGDWADRLVHEAAEPELAATIRDTLDLRDPDTGTLLSATEVGATMRYGSQCIEALNPDGSAVRGLLIFAVARGSAATGTDAIAREWSRLFVARSTRELPGLLIHPLGAIGTPYRFCQGG